MANINRTLEDIKQKYGPKVARAFASAISDLRSNVVLKDFVAAIERGDIGAAIRVLDIDESVFAGVRAQVTASYSEGGAAVMAATRFAPPSATRAVVRWDVTNDVAERFIRNEIGRSITQITNATLEGVRTGLANGYAQGQGPRQIALDIVGRVGANGARVGGVVGLSGPQTQWVSNMKSRLDKGDYRAVLGMSKRDRRFDRTILKAMRDGKSLTAKQVENITGRYSDRLLKLRGDTIARFETASAVEQARMDGVRVGMNKRGYPLSYSTKTWLHGGGGMKPREQHVNENNTKVNGLDTPFVMPDGTLMQRPLDPNAPPSHTINCTCTFVVGTDWAGLKRDGFV